jgi:hypothetical protein
MVDLARLMADLTRPLLLDFRVVLTRLFLARLLLANLLRDMAVLLACRRIECAAFLRVTG